MCGIAGIITKHSKDHKDRIDAMVKKLDHRGPDEHGSYFFENCAFGHARLSIVDISSGKQPMVYNNLGITFNGEIYGYENIRKELENNYQFKTRSDTEVIIALYKKYGDDFIKKLPGAFSFALWDDIQQKLIAGRDRFGEKPFYYAYGPRNEFIFASEIKSILATKLVEPVLDYESLAHYLKHLYVSPNKTIYKNIYTLPPAHMLMVVDGKAGIKKYWKLPPQKNNIEVNDAVETLRKLLDKSVKEQLVADVPVGAFLSGGIDSSTIVAFASRHKEKLKTFSFGFGESQDETIYAKEIADLYKTDHTELYPRKHDLDELLSHMQDVYDEPFGDSSNIPTYLLSEAAKKYVQVALTGDGGDELFAGYSNWYRPLLAMAGGKGSSITRMLTLYTAARVAFILDLRSKEKLQNAYLGERFRNKYNSITDTHLSQNTIFTSKEISDILLPRFQTKEPSFSAEWKPSNSLDDALRMDLEDYMPGDILVKIDRASMVHGLELRAPFLSKDFAEFAISLPWQMKITKDEDKAIFRKAFSDMWTSKIKNRKKRGFGAPVTKWLKEKPILALKEKFLCDPQSKIFSIISFKASRKFVENDSYKTWCLLVLAIWIDKHNFKF